MGVGIRGVECVKMQIHMSNCDGIFEGGFLGDRSKSIKCSELT